MPIVKIDRLCYSLGNRTGNTCARCLYLSCIKNNKKERGKKV